MNDARIPIFIIVHDRVQVLKKTFQSLSQLKTPKRIIFHNVASTYKTCLRFIDRMRKKGFKVTKSNVNNHLSVMTVIKKYLQTHPKCPAFIITDPDIELDNVHPRLIEFFLHIARKYKKPVGTMLRIDDIPDHYPLKKQALKRHSKHWDGTFKKWNEKWNNETFTIQKSHIDTTFQLRLRRHVNIPFPCYDAIRCHAPFSARHLDWYINPKKMTRDQIYYKKSGEKLTHWGDVLTKK